MKLTPFASVMTRMGAYDSLLQEKSTFYVELEECHEMMNQEKALLLIDELGRGTSTYDGMSIAFAVLKYLLKNDQQITFFTTHYH
jgi:DNA mismatch repair ATPase MutS